PATAQSDIYSLAVLLFYLLTGSFPTIGHTVTDLRRAHREGQLRSLRDIPPYVSRRFARIVERALNRETANPYHSAQDFARALSEIVAPSVPVQRPLQWILVGFSALALAAISAERWIAPRPGPTVKSFQLQRPSGRIDPLPAISADGSLVAYVARPING